MRGRTSIVVAAAVGLAVASVDPSSAQAPIDEPSATTVVDINQAGQPQPESSIQRQRRAFARISSALGDDRRGVAWYDPADDSTHLPVVGLSPQSIAELQAEGQRQMATKLVVERGDFSVAQLERIRDRVLSRLKPWVSADLTTKNGDGNRVSAGLSTERGKSYVLVNITPSFEPKARSVLAEMNRTDLEGGGAEVIRTVVEPLARAMNWSGPSVDGGDYIRFLVHGACSFGYVLGPYPYWGITAGHCMGLNHIGDGLHWTNAAADQFLQQIVWNAGYNTYVTATNNTVANDVAGFLTPYQASNPYPYVVWDGFPRVRRTPTATRNVRGVRTDELNMVIGLLVCHSGQAQKAEKCGTITGQNMQDVTYSDVDGNTRIIDGAYQANFAAAQGDSGGPVYWKWTYAYVGNAEPTGIYFAGVGSTQVFMTMQDIEAMTGRYTVAQAA